MTSSSARWQALDASTLLRRHWADEAEWVVYNAGSGDLHLLNKEAVALLDLLAARPVSTDELSDSAGTTESEAIRDALHTLDRLGLVAPILP